VRAQFWAAHRSELLRAGLGALAAIDTLIGGWALVLPGSFYRDFPGFGMHWAAAAPPYNEHLVTDFGAALLGIAVALVGAAIVVERRIVQGVLLAALVQALPHLIYHLSHPDMLPADQEVLSRLALVVPVALALGLLWLARHLHTAAVAAKTATRSSAAGSTR
jgi:hypothetical protein